MRRQMDAVLEAAHLRPKDRFESESMEDLVHAAGDGRSAAVVNAATALSLKTRSSVSARISRPTEPTFRGQEMATGLMLTCVEPV